MRRSARVKFIYYLDVLSSWCRFAEPAVEEVRRRFGDDLDYEWRIAVARDGKPMDYSTEAMAWYYLRSASMTGVQLNAVWLEAESDTSWWPNIAAEAARSLGRGDDRVRLALSRRVLVEGLHAQHREVATDVAAEASGLDRAALAARMDDPALAQRMLATTAQFRALPCKVLPTFLMSNDIGDVNLLSGAYRAAHIGRCVEQLLADSQAYEKFEAANPKPAAVKD